MAAAGSTSYGSGPRADALSWGGDHVAVRYLLRSPRRTLAPAGHRGGVGGCSEARSPLPFHAQVAEVLQGLFQELPSIAFQSVLQTAMKVVTVLGTQYTQETVEVILSLCHPSDR